MSTTRDKTIQPEPTDAIITSRNNPKVKQLRALLKRSERERTGLALIEGLRLVTEALRFPDLVRQMIVAPAFLKSQHGQDLVQSHTTRGSLHIGSRDRYAARRDTRLEMAGY